jgi:selenocysteine lyase/cysteine desulfurase
MENRMQASHDGSSHDELSAARERERFDVPEHITYLNCASLAPRLRSVSAAGQMALERMAAPWTVQSADWFRDGDILQQAFARLIGAPPGCVTLVPSVSYGIAIAARNIPVNAGDNIVVVEHEYPSNYYSWRRLCHQRGAQIRVAPVQPGADLTSAITSLIDKRTAVVATANCHWTDGTLVDLRQVAETARRNGSALVVDASQSLGAYPFDVAEVQPDFLVTVGYKWLLGPYALGYLYVAERWHGSGEPLEESWLHREGSENFATLADYTDAYKPGAGRFGQGESAQFYLLPMAVAALAQIEQWTPARIQHRLREWTDELAVRIAPLGLTCADANQRVGHMIGLKARHGLPTNFVARLAERGVYVGARGSSIRVSPHLHSSAADLERLVSALQEITS